MLPSLKMRGHDAVENMLKDVPYGAKKIVLPAVSEYIIGDDAHGLKHYPPQKDQQYERTYTLQDGWTVSGDTYRERITNSVEYSPYVPRWKRYGWREWADVVQSNLAGALRSANAKLNAWLRQKGYS
jgi:hypothetical protein